MRIIWNFARLALPIVALLSAYGPAAAAEAGKGPKEDERNLIAGICTTQLAIGDAACSCLADRAINELDQEQLNYLILSVVQPQTAEGSNVAKSQQSLASIFTFLEAARQDCVAAAAPPAAPAPDAGATGEPPAEGDVPAAQ
jgi:hypothetical protein